MDIKKIKALADVLNDKGLSSLELEEGDSRIKLERNTPSYHFSGETSLPEMSTPAPAVQIESAPAVEPEANSYPNAKEIKSPMVGVFYAAPSPESAPFVQVGDKVKKGDTLCVIEAMKLMNDIACDTDGEIAEICVSNGDVVEYSQTLFKIV